MDEFFAHAQRHRKDISTGIGCSVAPLNLSESGPSNIGLIFSTVVSSLASAELISIEVATLLWLRGTVLFGLL